MHPKYEHYRDEKYLEWVREQPCCITKSPPPNDPHHVWNTGKKGKRNDYCAVPMVRWVHTLYHSLGHEPFEKKHNVDLCWEIMKMLMNYIKGER